MPVRKDHDDYGQTMQRRTGIPPAPKGLHDYHDDYHDLSKPSFKDTAFELILMLLGIVVVFSAIIACVKLFA